MFLKNVSIRLLRQRASLAYSTAARCQSPVTYCCPADRRGNAAYVLCFKGVNVRFFSLMLGLCLFGIVGVATGKGVNNQLRCGTSEIGDTCLSNGRKGTCKRTKCCRQIQERGAKKTVCSPCARCAVTGLGAKQLGAKYAPILKANEALRKLKQKKSSKKSDEKADNSGGVSAQHLALLSVRHPVKKLKSRVPASPIPDSLNWAAMGVMLLLGAWGAWMGLTRR